MVAVYLPLGDLRPALRPARAGGDFPWVGKPGVMYSSCTDGRQTVVFKLERIED
jgi:uncharacterized repeat protein (TIGR04076 family)